MMNNQQQTNTILITNNSPSPNIDNDNKVYTLNWYIVTPISSMCCFFNSNMTKKEKILLKKYQHMSELEKDVREE